MSIMIITQGKDISPWVKALQETRPDLNVQVYPDIRDDSDITFALSWNHPLGAFQGFPNLKCIASMGAGVDHILKDPDLPETAVVTRVVDENLTRDMATFTLAAALNYMRGLTEYKALQHRHAWERREYKRVGEVTIGMMGLGVLGAHVAEVFSRAGFRVNGWARSARLLDGVTVYTGQNELNTFLAQANILICLLPLTKETAGILNKATFARLPKGAYLINVARGEHLVEEDLLEAIETGHLAGASLDVFREEPLPAAHPFWRHPNIDVTPHIASVTHPASVVGQILENYDRLRKEESLLHVVSRQRGY